MPHNKRQPSLPSTIPESEFQARPSGEEMQLTIAKHHLFRVQICLHNTSVHLSKIHAKATYLQDARMTARQREYLPFYLQNIFHFENESMMKLFIMTNKILEIGNCLLKIEPANHQQSQSIQTEESLSGNIPDSLHDRELLFLQAENQLLEIEHELLFITKRAIEFQYTAERFSGTLAVESIQQTVSSVNSSSSSSAMMHFERGNATALPRRQMFFANSTAQPKTKEDKHAASESPCVVAKSSSSVDRESQSSFSQGDRPNGKGLSQAMGDFTIFKVPLPDEDQITEDGYFTQGTEFIRN